MPPKLGLLTLSLFLVISAIGCESPGTLAVEQSGNQLPIQTNISADGEYGLFIAGQSDPLITVKLKQGDKLGFAMTEGGTVGAMRIEWRCAVAGERYIHLDVDTHYQWRRVSNSS
jgi:hypothetical protein